MTVATEVLTVLVTISSDDPKTCYCDGTSCSCACTGCMDDTIPTGCTTPIGFGEKRCSSCPKKRR